MILKAGPPSSEQSETDFETRTVGEVPQPDQVKNIRSDYPSYRASAERVYTRRSPALTACCLMTGAISTDAPGRHDVAHMSARKVFHFLVVIGRVHTSTSH